MLRGIELHRSSRRRRRTSSCWPTRGRPASAPPRRRPRDSTRSSSCFRSLDPNRFLDRTVKYVRWIWTPPVVAAGLLVLGCGRSASSSCNWGTVWDGTVELYASYDKPLLDILQFFFDPDVHRRDPRVRARLRRQDLRRRGPRHRNRAPLLHAGVLLRHDRLGPVPEQVAPFWVTTAGIYIEGFICAAATLSGSCPTRTRSCTRSPSRRCSSPACRPSSSTSIPLIKIDGYYALTSIVEIPELREDVLPVHRRRGSRRTSSACPSRSRRSRGASGASTGSTAHSPSPGSLVVMRFIGGLFFNLYRPLLPELGGRPARSSPSTACFASACAW